MFDRSNEHYKDAEDIQEKSNMAKHWLNVHPELNDLPTFSFHITGQFKYCISRQVTEAIQIMHSKDDLLNSKSEYSFNTISRITLEENELDTKKRAKLDEEVVKLEKHLLERFRLEKKRIPPEEHSRRMDESSILPTPVRLANKKRENDQPMCSKNKRRRTSIFPGGGKADTSRKIHPTTLPVHIAGLSTKRFWMTLLSGWHGQ